jgi:hypothetical protein
MGLLDKINRWRGFYGDSVTARQEFASFPLNFDSFEEFADPFALQNPLTDDREGTRVTELIVHVTSARGPVSLREISVY